MRNILLIIGGLVITVLISMGAFVYPGVRDAGYQGAGFVAKNICSGHFVSGMPVDQVIAEAIAPIDTSLGEMNVTVDEDAGTVDGDIYGLFARRAVRVPGAGCALVVPGAEAPEFVITELDTPTPTNQPWPLGEGPIDRTMLGVDYDALNAAIEDAFTDIDPDRPRNTKAIAVIWRGTLIAEHYDDGIDAATPLISWSMAKSVTNAQLALLYGREEVDLFGTFDVSEWQGQNEDGENDPRAEITLDQMLRMSSGLHFDETYAVGSEVTRMLSHEADAGAFAANMPLEHEPGEVWYYSSGTSNILSRLIRQTVGGATQDHYEFAQRELFWPLHAYSFVQEADPSGTFIGSSYVYASARDWARLGQLFLQDGVWAGNRLLPRGWVDYSRTATPNNPQRNYGAHFWLNQEPLEGYEVVDGYPAPIWPDVPRDAYSMNGFQGQHVVIVPSQDLVVVRLGFAGDYLGTGMNELVAGAIEAVNSESQ